MTTIIIQRPSGVRYTYTYRRKSNKIPFSIFLNNILVPNNILISVIRGNKDITHQYT